MKQRPTGVTILAALVFLGSAVSVISGMLLLVWPNFVKNRLEEYPIEFDSLAPIGGVVLLVIALLYGLIGYGLWRLRNLARILTLVFSVIEAAGQAIQAIAALVKFNVLAIVENAFVFSICGLIIWYLLQPHVKQAFAGSPPSAPAVKR